MPARPVVLVPLKPPPIAKQRLGLERAVRERLVVAMAADVVAAAQLAGADVTVVTADAVAADRLATLGARVVTDPGGGLNAALAAAGAAPRGPVPDAVPTVVAALVADVPAVRPADIAHVLAAARAAGTGVFAADRSGAGTTIVAGPGAAPPPYAFGHASAAAHTAAGLVALPDADVRLRHDVDTLDDLRAVLALGVGEHTADVCRDAGLGS